MPKRLSSRLDSRNIVLVDQDDVLADLLGGWISDLNHRHNLNIKPEEIDVWHLEDGLKNAGATLTVNEIFQPFNEPGLFRNLPVIAGAIDGLYSIKMKGLTPVIVTSLPSARHTPGTIVQEKLEWIEEHLAGLVHPRDVIFTYRKELVNGIVLIDDAPHNIKNYPGKTILFGNRGGNCKATYRAKTWDEVLAAIEKIKL